MTIIATAIVAVLMGAPTGATVLTFDKSPQFSNWPNSGRLWDTIANGGFPDYGDNVNGASQAKNDSRGSFSFLYGTAGGPTPNIVADYPAGPGGSPAQGMYAYTAPGEFPSGPEPVLFPYLPGDLTLRRMITLTGDPLYTVELQSFKGLFWNGSGSGSFAQLRVVRINEDSSETVLGNTLTNVAISGATGRTFTAADFGVASLSGPGIAIDMKPDGNQFNSFGFDDIQFAQQIPEPTAGVAMALAICFVSPLSRSRRRS
jgi:hypothetical protein